jgi:hypothetical protein
MRTALTLTSHGRARARIMRNVAVLEWHLGLRESAVSRVHEAITAMQSAVEPEPQDTAQLWADCSGVLARTGAKAESRDARRRAESILSAFGDQSGKSTVDWRELRR